MGQKISSGSSRTIFVNFTIFAGSDLNRPARLDALLERPHATKEEQICYAWNPEDKSHNLFIKDDDALTVHRHPVAQSTDCIRGKVGYSQGMHVWEIYWNIKHRGTHAVVGVATAEATLQTTGYSSLVGCDSKSWGWDLCRNRLCHNEQCSDYKETANNDRVYPKFHQRSQNDVVIIPDKFLVILDMDSGTLSFAASGIYLGIAFTGLRGLVLYPIVNAVWGHCEISMKYIGGMECEPLSLMILSRQAVRNSLNPYTSTSLLDTLPLPKRLIGYIKCAGSLQQAERKCLCHCNA